MMKKGVSKPVKTQAAFPGTINRQTSGPLL
ncbi:hypothetical protein SAMN04488121_107113 [Chitinophaga filiformis]|uniref:Uncharacterized protein n=1 Tax=Chitinophaga filiformis TaxID=104663 RepID=A0A1G7XWJ2_CHIFI|nr:hypothetical protein SAMN04488121_107113 [Chitinophaga filiformis]